MASEDFKDFLIGVGFLVDEAGAKKAQATHAKVEAGITATATAEAAKREAIEQKAGDARVSIAEAIMAMLKVDEERHTEARDKARKAEVAKDEAAAIAAVKKQRERRDEAIKSAGKFALNVASMAAKAMTALEGMALGIFWAADKAAGGMEKLQYAAAWAGTTPKGMNAFSYAAQQLGESAGEAEADLAKFGNTLKTIPAMEGVLKNMGISTRDAKGNWRDMADLATEYMAKLKDMPKLQREARGGMLGLGENTMRVGVDGRFAGYERQYKSDQDAVGNDDDANGKRGAAFEQSSRRLKSTVGGIYNRVMGGAMADLQPQLDKLQQWMADHGDQVAATLDRITKDIIALANAVLEKLSQINWNAVLSGIENFVKDFDKVATGAFGEEGSLIAPFALFGAALLTKFVGPLRTALEVLGALAAVPLPAWLGVAAVASGAASAEMAKRTGAAMNDPNAKFDPETGFVNDLDFGFGDKDASSSTGSDGGSGSSSNPKTGFVTWFKKLLGFGKSGDDRKVASDIAITAEATKKLADKADRTEMDGDGVTSSSGGLGGSGQHFGGGSSAGASLGDHARGGIGRGAAAMEGGARESFEFWKSKGLTPEQAAGLVGMEQGESGFNPRSIGDHGQAHGAFQWHADRRADIRAGAGIDVDTATHAQQLEAAYYEFQHKEAAAWAAIKKSRTASDAARAGVYHFERPGDKEGQSIVRGGMGEGWLKRFNGQDASPAPGGTTAGDVGSKIASMKSAGLLTDEQCVTLAMAAVGVKKGSGQSGANVHEWRKGDGADAGTLKAGTPVATFLDRQGRETDRYAGGGAGTPGAHLDHAGVFQKYVMDAYGKRIGMTLLEQYQGSRGAHLKDYLFGKGFGEANGSNYHAVLGPDGKPLGGGQPVKVEVTDASAAKIGKASIFPPGTVPHGGNTLADLKRSIFDADMAKQEKERAARWLFAEQR